MRFDSLLRSSVREQVEQLAKQMKSWEEQPKMNQWEENLVRNNLSPFAHTTQRKKLLVAAVHGSGDFPAVRYGDGVVYFTTARSTQYAVDTVSKLREVKSETKPAALVSWIIEDKEARKTEFDRAFARFAGMSVSDVVDRSDYRHLKAVESRKPNTIDVLLRELIYPHPDDAGNIAIQLRSTAELGGVLDLITREKVEYILIDTTLSLPTVALPTGSLFYEHLKRLCCVEARERGIAFLGLSKAHGFPAIDLFEKFAREKFATDTEGVAEHWYLRLPISGIDNWKFSLAETRRVPPAGVVSYLFRFHRTFPVMRLDMDREFWYAQIRGNNDAETQARERRIFEDLDYASHDQRCYGYPYPLTSSFVRASMTKSDRVALRKGIIEVAIRAGMKRSLFREDSQIQVR